MYKLGEQIAQARKSARITQEKLADELGLTRQAISSWERDNSQPDIDMVIKLSRILNYRFMIENNVYLGIMSEDEAAEGTLDQSPNNGINTAVQTGRKKGFISWIISFLAGALVVFLLMQFVVPLFNQPEAEVAGYSIDNGPGKGVTGPETIVWFQQKETPVPGKPYVEISFSENVCYPMADPDYESGYGWNYTVYLTEYNGYDFYPETFEKYHFITESHSGHNTRTADDMTVWWGESVIPARGQRCVSSGEPLQDIIGIGVKVTGKDANGETMEFYGYMECSQEIKE